MTMKWVCTNCDWSGDRAPRDAAKNEIYCPDCKSTIDDSEGRVVEERDGVAPSSSGGPATCNICEWEVPTDEIGDREDSVSLYTAHVRKEHPEMIEGTKYE